MQPTDNFQKKHVEAALKTSGNLKKTCHPNSWVIRPSNADQLEQHRLALRDIMYLLEGEILPPNLGPKYTDVIEETSAIEYKVRAANIHTVDYKTVTNPKGWEVKSLNLLEKTITGSTPLGSMSGMWDGEIQVVTRGDLGGVVKSSKRSVTEAGTSQSRSVSLGSLLACCIGATIGKVGIATRTVTWNAKIDDFFLVLSV
ncbi:hypothetical protein [Vibrio cholerae]|uniref:hypothetical protein n=1 Tax=Vibrio cholerae TaxID=666 RepID=UPI001655EED2|nr:hypothetical protein [Vibrio cholerae]HDI3253267.1 hypothetical protein [Vibrio cholerae]